MGEGRRMKKKEEERRRKKKRKKKRKIVNFRSEQWLARRLTQEIEGNSCCRTGSKEEVSK